MASDETTTRAKRRRGSMACARCRQRKMKCSGDAGDGKSCVKCSAAGINNCQFFRINTRPVNLNRVDSHRISGRFYQNMDPAIGQFPQVRTLAANTPTNSGFALGPLQQNMPVSQCFSNFGLGAGDQSIYSPGIKSLSCGAKSATDYSQSPGFLHSSTVSEVFINNENGGWNLEWGPVFNEGRSVGGDIYPEPQTCSLARSPVGYLS